MGVSGWLYRLVLLLHILTVVVAFGSLITNEVYARLARERGGPEGLAIREAGAVVTNRVAKGAFYAVPVLGILLVVLSDGAIGFDELWISLSFLLYLAAAVILLAVVIPTRRRADASAAAAVSGRPSADRRGTGEGQDKKLALSSGVFNLLFVALLFLMIFKPGT